MDAETIIQQLGLAPHPEGGFYRETYRSDDGPGAKGLPARYGGGRRFGTAIYYLLTPGTCSRLHRVKSDEVFHFYLGDPVRMLQLHEDGSAERIVLGADLAAGQRVQCVVLRGVWQGSYLLEGGRFALLGATVSPGFEFEDFELADRAALAARYPAQTAEIERLT